MTCMIMKMVWWIWILALTSLTTCLSESPTLTGHIEYCRRLHTFIVGNDANATSLTYTNTGLFKPIVITFENSLLPSPSQCGANYERCNVITVSNSNERIRVVMFPLDSGIGLVSFDYSVYDDSLVFREKFLLPKNEPNCTFVYFVNELIGYCLEVNPPRIRAFRIYIDFSTLRSSSIQPNTFVTSTLNDITSLSNFAYFVQHKQDNCFDNEGNHVLFINDGDLFDHSFLDERISRYFHEQIDTTCSRLHRVGSVCDLAVHCNDSTLVLDTRGQQHDLIFTEAEYGQTFFCPSENFISFQNETLTLHHPNRQQFGNSVPFPFGEIHQSYCLNFIDKFFIVATVDNSRTILVNFSDTSYRYLGDSDLSTMVSAMVKGHFAIVNNGSDTQIYYLGLGCMPEPLVLPNNFVLAVSAVFSTRILDQCQQCLDPATTRTISPIKPTIPAISPTLSSLSPAVLSTLESQSILVVSVSATPTPANEPVSSPVNSLSIGGIIGGVMAGAILISLSLIVVLLLVLLLIRKWSKKRKYPDNLELQTFNQDGVNFNDDTTNKQNVDLSSVENYEPQKQEVWNKESQEDKPRVILLENHLQQGSESLRTEVQAKDLRQEDLGTDSGNADTSTTLRDPQHNLSLVLHNVVCEEVGNETVIQIQCNPAGRSDSEPIIFEAEVHQDGNERVSVSPESPTMNPVPMLSAPLSPMHSAEPDSGEDSVYTQPLTDTNGEASLLLLPTMQPELRGGRLENRNSSPTGMRDSNGVDDSSTDCLLPLQDTNNSQARLVVSDTNCTSFQIHPDNLRDKCHQYDDKTNSEQYRRLVAQVGGGGLWNEEPNNDRCLMDNADVIRQISADSEHLTSDPDVLRQISTDSEESRG